MLRIQIIHIKPLIFRTEKNEYLFVKPNILYQNLGERVEAKVKGSCLGWNIEGEFLSYNKLKKLINGSKYHKKIRKKERP